MTGAAEPGEAALRPRPGWLFATVDAVVTTLLWIYYIAGFVVLFGPVYLVAALVAPGRQATFQRFNHLFYRSFFGLCRLLMPRQRWRIDPAMHTVRGSVIVCNHISYIDPILLISLFPRHTTIVKNRLFQLPVFSAILGLSGYLPAASQGRLAEMMQQRLGAMGDYLATGGNLIVFPEGTRSRSGRLGAFNPGAFKIAKLCRAPLAVVRISHTDRLCTPGKFLFNTWGANVNRVDLLARLTPDYDSARFSLPELMEQVHTLLAAPTPRSASAAAGTDPD